jgi:hypothetical protein
MKRLSASPVASLALLLGASWLSSGCLVPSARYEEARSAIRVEQESHRRTQEHLGEISRKLEHLQLALNERERRLEVLESDLAESRLTEERAESARRFAVGLMEQLRGELSRTGGHLREFAEDKRKLALALDAAQAREKRLAGCEQDAADNAALVRDVALLLHEPISTGEVELSVVEGRAVLRLPSSELSGETPEPVGARVLAAVARVTQLHPESRVRLAEEGAPSEPSEGGAVRLRAISDMLADKGLAAQRVELEPAADSGSGEPTIVIAMFAGVRSAPPPPAEVSPSEAAPPAASAAPSRTPEVSAPGDSQSPPASETSGDG